jgi:hypothetical protein
LRPLEKETSSRKFYEIYNIYETDNLTMSKLPTKYTGYKKEEV